VCCRAIAFLLLGLAGAVHGAESALARFEAAPAAAPEVAPLLQKVLDGTGQGEDAEDDERLLRRVHSATLEVLKTEGYFAPSLNTEADPEHRARYLLRLDPGPRALVTDVQIRLSGAIEGDAERVAALVSGWTLAVGQPFRDAAWASAKSALLTRVRERDFAAASIAESAAEVVVETASVRLRVVIASGPAFTLGALEVKGLQRYQPELVERYNPFKPGDRYDAARLLDFQRQLQLSPYFGTVLVDVDTDGAPENAPIRVDVTEAKTKRVATSIGYSTDTGPELEVTYRQAILFGHPYALSTGVHVDPTRAAGFVDIFLPRKPGGALDSVGVLRENTDLEGLSTRRWSAGVRRAYASESEGVTQETRLSLSIESETDTVDGSSEAPQVNDYIATSYTWTRKAVDQITNPTRGDLLTLSGTLGLQRGSLGELLKQSFVRLYGRYVRYVPLSPRDQLILRGEAGHVVVDDPAYVPNDYLFRTGGVGSVRGYDYESLGVRVGTSTTGSQNLLVGSAEYVRWLNKVWGAAFFFDAGDAADDLRLQGLAHGYGVGVRWKSVAGPLALDLAYGERERQWRLCFAIAIAY
jgi:translocation and assembly module TamA